MLHYKQVLNHFCTRGWGSKTLSRGTVNSKEENFKDFCPRIRPLVSLFYLLHGFARVSNPDLMIPDPVPGFLEFGPRFRQGILWPKTEKKTVKHNLISKTAPNKPPAIHIFFSLYWFCPIFLTDIFKKNYISVLELVSGSRPCPHTHCAHCTVIYFIKSENKWGMGF